MINLDKPVQSMPPSTPQQGATGQAPGQPAQSPYATGLYNQRAPAAQPQGAATLRPAGPAPMQGRQPPNAAQQKGPDANAKFKLDLARAAQLKQITLSQMTRLEALREIMREKGIPTSEDQNAESAAEPGQQIPQAPGV